jgi:hypothetical protein
MTTLADVELYTKGYQRALSDVEEAINKHMKRDMARTPLGQYNVALLTILKRVRKLRESDAVA